MKQLIFLFILCGGSLLLQAQPQLKDYKASALDAVQEQDYATALVHSRQVLEEEPNNLEYLAIATEAALEYCEFELANNFLYRIESLDTANAVPQFSFLKGKYFHRTGQYDEADAYYRKYQDQCQQSGSNSPYLAIANTMVAHLEASANEDWFLNYKESYLDRGIDVEADEDVDMILEGGRDSSLFAMPVYQDSLYYTAIGPELEGDCACTNLCEDEIALYRYETPGMSRRVTSTDGLKDVGHIAYGNGGNRMYFTQCTCDDGNYSCSLYYRDRNSSNTTKGGAPTVTWGEAQKIAATDWKGFNVTQPFVYVGEDGIEYLFFVTNYTSANDQNRDLDIWYATVQGGVVNSPAPVTQVNTDGDDMTPFYHGPTQTFYFSSNGRKSLGGYDFDIYSISGPPQNLDINNITNVGAPINSRFDDYYYSLSKTGDKGFFSSNRHARSRSSDIHDFTYCCPDVFEIELTTDLPVLVFCGPQDMAADYGREPLRNTQIQLMDETGANPPVMKDLEEPSFTFEELRLNTQFMVVGSKAQYASDTSRIGNLSLSGDTAIVVLEPEMELGVGFRDRCDETIAIDVDAIMVLEGFPAEAPTSWDTLRYDRYTEGHFNEVRGMYVVDLKPMHKYIIVADTFSISDPEYFFCTNTLFEFDTPCEPFSEEIIFKLEQRDEEITSIPPLYFDHAVPSRNFSRTISEFDYFQLVDEYLNKAPVFATANCNDPANLVDTLFNDIFRNQDEMAALIDNYLTILEYFDLEIEIAGFASSSGSSGYSNLDLTKRRIDSMRKSFEKKMKERLEKIQDPERREELLSRYVISNIKFIPKPFGATLANKRDMIASDLFGVGAPPSKGECRKFDVRSSRDRGLRVVSVKTIVPGDDTSPPEVLDEVPTEALVLNLFGGIIEDLNFDDPNNPFLIMPDGNGGMTERMLNPSEYAGLLSLIDEIRKDLGRPVEPDQVECPCPEEISFESQRASTTY